MCELRLYSHSQLLNVMQCSLPDSGLRIVL
jgi:hypothetical protein